MVATFLAELQSVLSVDRMERYRPPSGSDLDMLSAYFWNVQLCELLYHPLGALEKALRNSINTVLIAHTGQVEWYDTPNLLEKRQAMEVAGAKFDIAATGKAVVPGRIIAAQNFGFWTSLLSQGYSKIWTSNNQSNMALVFPYAPATMKYRKPAFEHLNAIRLLRTGSSTTNRSFTVCRFRTARVCRWRNSIPTSST